MDARETAERIAVEDWSHPTPQQRAACVLAALGWPGDHFKSAANITIAAQIEAAVADALTASAREAALPADCEVTRAAEHITSQSAGQPTAADYQRIRERARALLDELLAFGAPKGRATRPRPLVEHEAEAMEAIVMAMTGGVPMTRAQAAEAMAEAARDVLRNHIGHRTPHLAVLNAALAAYEDSAEQGTAPIPAARVVEAARKDGDS